RSGHERRRHEPALASGERLDVHDRRTVWRVLVTRPLDAAHLLQLLERDSRECWCDRGYFGHDLTRMVIVHGIAHRCGDPADDVPLVLTALRLHHGTHPVDPALR